MIEMETPRLTLRPFRHSDRDAYHAAIFSDPDVMKYLPGGLPRPVARTRAVIDYFINHWKEHHFGGWAMIYKDEDRLIGHCGLQMIPDTDEVEVFYALGRPYWGQGLATEAGRAALQFAFEQRGMKQVFGLALPQNTDSRRVLEKIGMTYQGITAKYYNAELAYYLMRDRDYRVRQRTQPTGDTH